MRFHVRQQRPYSQTPPSLRHTQVIAPQGKNNPHWRRGPVAMNASGVHTQILTGYVRECPPIVPIKEALFSGLSVGFLEKLLPCAVFPPAVHWQASMHNVHLGLGPRGPHK